MTSNTSDVSPWPRPAVSVMVFRGNEVLLGQRSKPPLCGLWSLPGGRVEAGETVEAAGLRELLEETGVTARLVGHAGLRDIIHRDARGEVSVHYVLNTFVGVWQTGEAVAGSDCMAVMWVPVDELEAHDLTEETAGLIRDTHSILISSLDASGEPK